MVPTVRINGQKLTHLREDLHLTQEEFAGKLGMTRGGVARLEGAADVSIRVKTFRRIAELTGASHEELRERIGGVASVMDDEAETPRAVRARENGESIADIVISMITTAVRAPAGKVEDTLLALRPQLVDALASALNPPPTGKRTNLTPAQLADIRAAVDQHAASRTKPRRAEGRTLTPAQERDVRAAINGVKKSGNEKAADAVPPLNSRDVAPRRRAAGE